MPSVYQSCTIDDQATEALNALKQHLGDIQQEFNDQLAVVEAAFNDLEGEPVKASVTIGPTVDSQIKWTAQVAGRAGNNITISYVYLGPVVDITTGIFSVRWPTSVVSGNNITLYLGSTAAGDIGATWLDLFYWLSNPDVVDLVQGELVGTGADSSEPTPATPLTGGKDRGITATESAANQVSEVFGQKDYRTFLRDLEVPVIETAADIAQYINADDRYVVVNDKLLIISGTNLQAINKLYGLVGNDLDQTRNILAQINTRLPTMVTTQDVSTVTYQTICDVTQPVTTVTETYRNLDTNVLTTASVYGGGTESLHHYVFWGEQLSSTQSSYDRLLSWGLPEEYIGDILANESPEQDDWLEITAPEVYLVDSLTLLTDLGFTDAELEELLQLGLDGVQIPHKVAMDDRIQAIKDVLSRKPATDDNGLRNRVKAPIAAIQGMDIGKTTDDQNLSKELATRGKACARSTDRLAAANIDGFNIPNLDSVDLPNADFGQLPDPAKKIESAFGALSGGVSAANKAFDLMVGSLTKTVGGILNKVMNVSSMVDNMFGNALAQCLLGTTQQATGAPDIPEVGGGSGSSIPDISGVLGGLPLPMDLLKDAFKALSVELDETITDAFETLMGILQKPLCIVQSLLSSLTGFDLGGLFDVCQDGSNPDDKCPAEDVQAVIDASTDLTSQLGTIPSLEGAPTTLPEYDVAEEVRNFTGTIQKTVTETTQTVTRGIEQTMDEISKSVDAKLEMVEQFDKAIRELFGDARDTKENIDEEAEENTGCAPAVLGALNDAVADWL